MPVGGPRQVALLALLLLHANRAVASERLIDIVWGDDAGDTAGVKRLQMAIARLRRALEPNRSQAESALRTVAGGYLLTVRPGELDADVFQARMEEGCRALEDRDAQRASEVLREALGLWRGPPLAEVAYEDFAQAEIRRLEELRVTALETCIEADLQLGRHATLIGELESLVVAHPTRERLAGQLMLALYRCGRQAEALDAYQRVRSHLSEALGLEPGPTLKALQQAVLDQDASLDLNRHRPSASARRTAGSQRVGLPSALLATGQRELFVGREADLEQLTDVYARAAAGDRQLVLRFGEPGIGKTRLARELACRAHDDGATVLYGRCDEEGLLALQPFVEALRHYVCSCPRPVLAGHMQLVSGELRRVVPELVERIPDLPEPLPGDPEGARSRLFEAMCALLCEAAQEAPLVLVLDDLHWADKATLLLLKYLARYPRQARLMVLGTYRETELDRHHPLSAFIAELGREHLLERRALSPLDPPAVSELVAAHAGVAAATDLRQVVYEATEGNPFFVVEVLRDLAESGAITAEGQDARADATVALAVPETVKDVLGQRLTRLGPEAHQVLTLAAVLGRAFELDVLGPLVALPEDELVDVLERAVRARVIDEAPAVAGRYAFSHALIRDALYRDLSATRRALLHRRAATALEDARCENLEPYIAQLAHHLALAGGSGDLDKAIEYGSRAGEQAIAQLAYERAAAHFRQTIALLHAADPMGRRPERCDLLIAEGEAERQAGAAAYRQTLLEAARLAQELHDADRLARAALANNRGFSSSAQGVDRDRVSVLRAALDAYGSADSPTRAALLALLALELVSDADWRQRDKLSDEALAMARRIGHPGTLALVLTQRAVAQWRPQKLPEFRADLREAAELADRLGDPQLAGHAAYLGAHAAMEAGELAEADRLLARLNGVARDLNQPVLRWYDLVAQAKRHTITGPAAQAERLAFAASEVGTNAGQPDVWLWFLGQLFVARFLQGALDREDPHLPDLFPTPGSTPPASDEITPSRWMPHLISSAMSVVLCEVGRLDDARAHFEAVMTSDLDDLPHDYTALAIPVQASIACARLRDTASAKRLQAILAPHSHRLVNTGASWLGATTHYLGLLAATIGDLDEAEAHFHAAERSYTSLNADPWLARLYADWADALVPAGAGDAERRAEHLRQRAGAHRRPA